MIRMAPVKPLFHSLLTTYSQLPLPGMLDVEEELLELLGAELALPGTELDVTALDATELELTATDELLLDALPTTP